jgi:hypothetical protein
MFVILTSKPGQYRTEPGAGVEPVEAWDYVDCGRTRAKFVIASLEGERRVRVIDDSGPVNDLPSKFLDKYDSVEAARAALQELARHGGADTQLRRAA